MLFGGSSSGGGGGGGGGTKLCTAEDHAARVLAIIACASVRVGEADVDVSGEYKVGRESSVGTGGAASAAERSAVTGISSTGASLGWIG